MRMVLGGLALMALALLTSDRVTVYQSDLTLWADARLKAPGKPRPTLNYAAALIRRQASGDLQRAKQLAQQADSLASRRSGWEYKHGQDIARRQLALIRWLESDRTGPLLLESPTP